MKNLFLPAIAFATIFTSCSGEDISPEAGVVNCTIDGDSWVSTQANAAISDGIINVTGVKGNDILTFTLTDNGEGSYNLEEGNDNAAAFNKAGASNSYVSHVPKGKGELTITEIDNTNETVSGTFEFVGVLSSDDSKKMKFKNGHFEKIPFNVEPAETENELSAKVNGVDFNPTYIYAGSSYGMISISANVGGSFPSIGLALPNEVTPGSYTPSMFGDYRAQYVTDNEDISGSSDGTIIISAHDTEANILEGTFEYTDEGYEITEGSFLVQY